MDLRFLVRDDATTDLIYNGILIRNTASLSEFEAFATQHNFVHAKTVITDDSGDPCVRFGLSTKMTPEQKSIFEQRWLLKQPASPATKFKDDELDKWARKKQLADLYGEELVNTCLRKVRHKDRKKAQDALRSMLAESYYSAPHGKRLITYPCEHCCGFHVGHAYIMHCDTP